MSIEWPASLPQCPLRGRQRAPQPNVISLGTEVGEGKVRRRSTARTKRITMTFVLTRAQVAIFEAFFEDDIADGALSFTMNDSADQTTRTWRFDPQSPYSLDERASGKWSLTANLTRIG